MRDDVETPMPLVQDIAALEPVEGPAPLANQLDFTITTDSVVATATVKPSGNLRKIFIAWGDGETSSLTTRPGIIPPTGAITEQDNPLPAGTYQLSHAYAEPEDRMPFEYYVLLRVQDWAGGDEIRLERVVLTPRYRVTHYRARVKMINSCDPSYETTSEFDILLTVDGTKVNSWHWEPSQSFIPGGDWGFSVLTGSQISRELTVGDYVSVQFDFTETDWISDVHMRESEPMSALHGSESISHDVSDSGLLGACTVRIRYDREVSLIVPLPDMGHDVVFA